jgi:signal transduction histidine kinase
MSTWPKHFAEELGLLRAANPKAQIQFETTGPTDGEFDASKLREALSNLVTNAVEHGAPPASIYVRLRGNARSVQIEVENLGDIPAGEIEGLFEPLRRRESAHSGGDRTHLGLGLFIVRQIAKAHAGDIAGQCIDGTVVFTIELPRR